MADVVVMKPDLVLDARAAVAETPVWDDRTQMLYWVDIENCRIHRFDPATGEDRFFDAGQMAGSIALRENGSLIAALANGFYYFDFDAGQLNAIADPESDLPANRFNDGKCDPAGRFWAGTMGLTKPRQPVGSLYVLDNDLSIRRQVTGVKTSNGLAWSLDHKILYYIDTHCQTVDAFDYDLKSGTIANRRVAVRIPDDQGRPDGMTIDSEGMLWVAHWSGWRVARYDPKTGEQLAAVQLPVANVSCCTFGGRDLDVLYITTARKDLSEDQLGGQPLAGGLFAVHPGVTGLKADRFQG